MKQDQPYMLILLKLGGGDVEVEHANISTFCIKFKLALKKINSKKTALAKTMEEVFPVMHH